jgi:hypothetical protein
MTRSAKKPAKLSENMQTVVNLMQYGWELCRDGGPGGSAWMQDGGCGGGGMSIAVHQATFFALYDRGLIEQVDRKKLGTHRYRLRETKP